jgi:hypothetical protein
MQVYPVSLPTLFYPEVFLNLLMHFTAITDIEGRISSLATEACFQSICLFTAIATKNIAVRHQVSIGHTIRTLRLVFLPVLRNGI